MRLSVLPVSVSEAYQVKRFMQGVIASSVTTEEPVFSETVANVNSNVDWWLGRQSECVHLKAELDRKLVGVVLVKAFWNLCSLFVAAEAQRLGIGRALVEAAIAECRGRSPKDALWLNAAPKAQSFYLRLGFSFRESSQVLPPGFRAMQLPL